PTQGTRGGRCGRSSVRSGRWHGCRRKRERSHGLAMQARDLEGMRLPSITVMTRDCSACGAAYKRVHDEKRAARIGRVRHGMLAGKVQQYKIWNNNDIVQEAGSQSMTSTP